MEETGQEDIAEKTKEKIDITSTLTRSSEKVGSRSSSNKDIYIEASELTPAEQLAQEVYLFGCYILLIIHNYWDGMKALFFSRLMVLILN